MFQFKLIKSSLFLVWFLLFFGYTLKAQTFSAQEIVDYWNSEDEQKSTKFRSLDQYLEPGLPKSDSAIYQKITDLLGQKPEPKLLLYLEGSKLLTQSFQGNHTNGKLLAQVNALLPLASKVDDKFALAWFYRFLGRVNYFEKEYARAIYYIKLSLDFSNQIGLQKKSPDVYSNVYYTLAKTLYDVKDYNQSIIYGKLALKNMHLMNIPEKHEFYIKSYILINDLLGAAQKRKLAHLTAIKNYKAILTIIQKNKLEDNSYYKFWKGLTIGNIGQVYLNKGDLSVARDYIQIGLKASEETNDIPNIFEFNVNLAQIAYLNEDLNVAQNLANKAKLIMESYPFKLNTIHLYQVLYQVNLKQKKYINAIQYLSKYKDLVKENELLVENNQLKKVEVELDYNRLQKEEKERLMKINQLKWIRNSLIFVVILIAFCGWFIYSNHKAKQLKELELLKLEKEISNQEVESAKKQIANFKKSILDKENLILNLEAKAEASWRKKTDIPDGLKHFVLITEDGWNAFRVDFNIAYPRFLPLLRSNYPTLSPSEERLAMLIFLKLDNLKIAHSLGISKDSVAKSKRRMRSTMGFNSNQSLEDYIITLV